MTPSPRLRAPLLGLVCGVGLVVATCWNNAVLGNAPLGGGHLPLAPTFLAVWLFVLAALWQRVTHRSLLTGGEVLVIWLVSTIFTGIAYAGLAQTFFVATTAPDFFARDAFGWTDLLGRLLPNSWRPTDPALTETLYNGLPGGANLGWRALVDAVPWRAWAGPLTAWGLFIMTAYFVMYCLAHLLGRQWVVNERMDFPLLRVPRLMADAVDGGTLGAFWRDGFLLCGLGLSLFIHTLNGLHAYLPTVPEIPTLVLAGSYFPKFGLFSGFHKLKLYIVPAFIGFAFLTPRQISFSLWGFHIAAGLLVGVLYVLGLHAPEAALGVTFGPEFSRPEQAQVIGAGVVFALFILWLARGNLLGLLWQDIRWVIMHTLPARFRRTAPPEATTRAASWPMWGLILGLAGLAGWCEWYGMPPAAAIGLPVAAVVTLLVVSRLICQGGLPLYVLTVAPLDALIGVFGSGFLGRVGLTAGAVVQKVLFMDLRETLLPTLFHSEKIRESMTRQRLMHALLLVSIGAAAALALAVMLIFAHKYGVRELHADWAIRSTQAVHENVERLLDAPMPPNPWTIGFAALGAGVMALLVLCYYRLPWWPLHPLGYLAAYDASMKVLWFSILIGWLCNHLCLHYGGTALFKRVRLFFAGLILGDVLMGGLWTVAGMLFGPAYSVFPL